MKRILGVVILMAFALAGCSTGQASGNNAAANNNDPTNPATSSQPPKSNSETAVYLTTKTGGQLTQSDLSSHPQVVSVYTVGELESTVDSSNNPLEIWIDKSALSKIKSTEYNWLTNKAKDHYEFALVGYNNSLYSFRDKLDLYGMQGPFVDWSKVKLQPGFSIAIGSGNGVYFSVYKGVPSVQKILARAKTIKTQGSEGKSP